MALSYHLINDDTPDPANRIKSLLAAMKAFKNIASQFSFNALHRPIPLDHLAIRVPHTFPVFNLAVLQSIQPSAGRVKVVFMAFLPQIYALFFSTIHGQQDHISLLADHTIRGRFPVLTVQQPLHGRSSSMLSRNI